MINSYKEQFIDNCDRFFTEHGRVPNDAECDALLDKTRDDFADAADQLRKRRREEGEV